MSLELYVKFPNKGAYKKNKSYIEEVLRESSSFIGNNSDGGLLFKLDDENNSWDYDVRIFFHDEFILIEVSFFGKTFYEELKSIFNIIKSKINFDVTDDDDELFEW